MRASRGLVLNAVWMAFLCVLAVPVPSSAQVLEAARRALDLSPDPTERTPRLLGMGRLTLASDRHNRIDLWDFAASPVGILDADSGSTCEVWPATSSSAAWHVPVGSIRGRQTKASRETRMRYEIWRRTEEGNAYGFHGDFATLRTGRPFSQAQEIRGELNEPSVTGVLSGPMPFFQSERMRYAVRISYSDESSLSEYRTLLSNAQGEQLGKESQGLSTPDIFTPNEYNISTLGGGVALSYRFAPWLIAAVGGDATSSNVQGENSSLVHLSGTGEDRPYYLGKATLIGRLGTALEWGVDGQFWESSSQEDWVFSLKTGLGQPPLTGRGLRQDRREEGSDGRVRLRWTQGPLELNAGSSVTHRDVRWDPIVGNLHGTSYNFFLLEVSRLAGADSLALPELLTPSRVEERDWEAAYGLVWRLPEDRGLVGGEYHFARHRLHAEERLAEGPYRWTWDVRGGVEYACTPVFTGRIGYIRRSDDRDEFTTRNEFTSNTATFGFGVRPPGVVWSLEAGYAFEWLDPDFDDATQPRESRQLLAAQLRWAF